MPKCLKGFRMETKKCRIVCTQCDHYEARTKKELLRDARAGYAKQIANDKLNYRPARCNLCKYYEVGTAGFNSACRLNAELSFSPMTFYKEYERFHPLCPLRTGGK